MNRCPFAVALCAMLIVSASLSLTASAAANDRRQLGAHEHGVTTLNIALDNGTLILELEGPAMNFVGFEHAPSNPEQERAISDALTTLNSDPALFGLDSEAGCVLIDAQARHVMADDHDDHAHEHDDNGAEARHSEFMGEYRYDCARPEDLTNIVFGLFERFPLTTEVEASFIGPEQQTFRELSPEDPTLRIRR